MCRDCDVRARDKDTFSCSNTFWLESPACLLTDLTLVVKEGMSLEEKMNIITRIVIIVFIVLLILKYKHALPFLLGALVIIAALYYSSKRRMHERRSRHSRNESNMGYTPDRIYVESGNLREQSERFYASAGKKSKEEEKRNPRKPYPPTVPADLVVKSRRANLNKGISIFTDDPKYAKYIPQTNSGQEDRNPSSYGLEAKNEEPEAYEVTINTIEEDRKKYLMKSYKGESKYYPDFHVQDFRDDAEEDDLDDDDLFLVEQEVKAPSKPRFLPANYESSLDEDVNPMINTSVRSHGAGRRPRAPVRWGDKTRETRTSAADLMFARAAKLEKATNARHKATRESQMNTMVGN